MLRLMKYRLLLPSLLFFYTGLNAQTKDFGVWTTVDLRKDVGKWDLGLSVELRTNDNSSQIHRWSYQLKASYKIIKSVEAGVGYKFICFHDVEYSDYQPRQRYMSFVTGKYKLGDFKFSLREKVQRTIKDEGDRVKETGNYDNYKINPEWTWRNRLKVDYNIPKFPINPAFSVETFYQLNNPDGDRFEDIRYTLQFKYKLTKHHKFRVYELIDKEINIDDPVTTYVTGFTYVYSF